MKATLRNRIRRAALESAARRQCPSCGRKGALTVRRLPFTSGLVHKRCRWCGWSNANGRPPDH